VRGCSGHGEEWGTLEEGAFPEEAAVEIRNICIFRLLVVGDHHFFSALHDDNELRQRVGGPKAGMRQIHAQAGSAREFRRYALALYAEESIGCINSGVVEHSALNKRE
jgi:hypothetical protein